MLDKIIEIKQKDRYATDLSRNRHDRNAKQIPSLHQV